MIRAFFWLTVLLAVLHLGGLAVSDLPDRVVLHFGPTGEPDRFGSPASFLRLYAWLVVGLSLTFEGIAALVHWLDPQMLNLPNKEHWLAPERRTQTLDWVARWSWSYGAGTLLFLITTMQIAVDGSYAGQLAVMPFTIALLAYLGFTVWRLAALVQRFSTIP